jgi:hypothetical protein
MPKTEASRAGRRLFGLAVAALAVSGMAQMPVFKRYGVADLPGLAWTADFFFTHLMHYAAAAVLLFLLSRAALTRLAERRPLPGARRLAAAIWAGLAITGLALVVKNLPGWTLGPGLTKYVDWTHLGLAVLLGLTALTRVAVRRRVGEKNSAHIDEHQCRKYGEELALIPHPGQSDAQSPPDGCARTNVLRHCG